MRAEYLNHCAITVFSMRIWLWPIHQQKHYIEQWVFFKLCEIRWVHAWRYNTFFLKKKKKKSSSFSSCMDTIPFKKNKKIKGYHKFQISKYGVRCIVFMDKLRNCSCLNHGFDDGSSYTIRWILMGMRCTEFMREE